MNDSADVAHASLSSVISEEPQEFRHATSLDNALQHLIPTLQSHKGDLDLFFTLGCSFQEPCTCPALASSVRVHFTMMITTDSSYAGINFRNDFLIIACL